MASQSFVALSLRGEGAIKFHRPYGHSAEGRSAVSMRQFPLKPDNSRRREFLLAPLQRRASVQKPDVSRNTCHTGARSVGGCNSPEEINMEIKVRPENKLNQLV
jgi:hypothetical protein